MKPSTFAAFTSLTILGIAAGCSSNSSGGFAPASDAGIEAGPEAAPPHQPYFGAVDAVKTIADATSVYSVDADFVATGDASVGDGGAFVPCTQGTLVGSCCYLPPGLAGDAGTPTVTFDSAGTILFKDGSAPIANLTQKSGGAYGFTSAMSMTLKWQPGDTLEVVGSGGTVEAFDTTFATVADLASVTPSISYTTPMTVPLNSPFVVAWSAGTSNGVHLQLTAINNSKIDGSITCAVEDSAGTLSVSATLLSKLTSGDTGVINLSRSTTKGFTGSNVVIALVSTSTVSGAVKFN